MAKVIIQYEAETASLKAAVSEVNKVNDEVVKSAQDSSAKVAQAYKDTGKAAAAAFASNGVKKAIDDQNKSAGDLAAKLKVLYAEEVKLLDAGQKASKAYQDNQKQAEALRKQIASLNDETESLVKATQAEEKATKSLSTQLRDYKNALAQLEQQGKENTKEFEAIAVAAAKLEDQIGDTRERVKSLASDTFVFDAAIDSVNALAGGFAVVQGAVGLFAEDNQELQEAIAKTNSALAILNGLQQVQAFLTGQSAGKLALLSAAQGAYATVVGESTGKMKLFRIALAATGIGLAVAAIGLLISAIQQFISEQERFNAALRSSQKAIQDSQAAINELADVTEKANIRIAVAQGKITQSQADLRSNLDDVKQRSKDALAPLIGAQLALQKQIEKANSEADAQRKILASYANNRSEGAALAIAAAQSDLATATDRVNKLTAEYNANAKAQRDVLDAQTKATKAVIAAKSAEDEAAKKTNQSKKEQEQVTRTQVAAIEQLTSVTIDSAQAQQQLATATGASTTSQINAVANAVKTSEVIYGSSLDRRIKLIDLEGKARVEAVKASIANETERASAIELIEAETQQKIRDEYAKTRKEQIDNAIQIAQAYVGAFQELYNLSKQLRENRIADIKKASDFELEAINNSTATERQKQRQREALALRTNRLIRSEEIKQARADKAIAIFTAAINTAVAVTKVIANPFLAAAVGIAGAAQIAAIAAKPIPKFERGGVIGGRRHSAGGTIVEAERDEFIVNRNQSMKHRNELEAINTSTAAFRRLIDERYVRPAIHNFMLSNRGQSVRVNATLNSKGMEQELKAMRKSMKRPVVVNIATNDKRYQWHNR